MSNDAMQYSFDFEPMRLDPAVAAAKAAEELPTIVVPWSGRRRGDARLAEHVDAFDKKRTIVLGVGGSGLTAVPLSVEAATKLFLWERSWGRLIEKELTYETLLSPDGAPDTIPVVPLLNAHGIDVVMSVDAWTRLRGMFKQAKRVFTPYRFYVPEHFKDLSGNVVSDVQGPFVDEVYADEIAGTMAKLKEMDLLADDERPDKFSLYGYQAEDVCRLAVKRRAYLGHDMGIGKTAIAVATARVLPNRFVLVVAPTAAIGSFVSGWRHEIARQGVPHENIHLIEQPEDLPTDKSAYPDNGEKHFFLVDYTTLSKDKVEWSSFPCPRCHNTVPAANHGKCRDDCHVNSWEVYSKSSAGSYIPGFSKLTYCPMCADKAYRANGCHEPAQEDIDKLTKIWTGNYCDPVRGGCGFRTKVRVVPVGRAKKGYTKANPIWKYIKKGMFGTLCVDESHMIRNIASKRSLAVQMLRGVKNVYIMTGTMMSNYVSDTFWQLHRLCPRGLFPVDGKFEDFFSYSAESSKKIYGSKDGYTNFLSKYEGSTISSGRGGNKITRINNPESFWRMMSCFMVRRRADDPDVEVTVQLPPTTIHHEFIEMDTAHDAVYKVHAGQFCDQIQAIVGTNAGGMIGSTQISTNALMPVNEADLKMKLQQLRIVAACPDTDPAYGERMTTKDARMIELIRGQIKHPDGKLHKTVVFTVFGDHMNRLSRLFEKEGIPTAVINSDMNKYAKWAAIDEWRTTEDSAVLISTIRTFGTAVNLTSLSDDFECDMVLFGSPEWSPGPMEQAWKRVHRIGQRSPVNVHYLYHKDTIEQHIDELVQSKLEVINAAIDRRNYDRDGDVTEISAHDIAARIINGLQEGTTA